MKKPIKTYFDTVLRSIVITDKKLNDRYRYLASYSDVPRAETAAEKATEEDGEIFRPILDIDLAEQSAYSLSPEDVDVYCVEL